MEKRGQVTFIIIIAVVLIAIILIVYALATKTNLLTIGQGKISPELQPIYDQMNDCIEQRAIDSAFIIGLQGGHLVIPENHLETETSIISFGIYNGKNTIPTISEIEDSIANYIKLTILFCVGNSKFPDSIIDNRDSEVDVIINQDSVDVKAKLSTTITKGENTFELKEPYTFEIPIRLGRIHETANLIVEKQLEDKDYVDITFLTNLDFDVAYIPFSNRLIYIITDEESTINDIPYSFIFGARL